VSYSELFGVGGSIIVIAFELHFKIVH